MRAHGSTMNLGKLSPKKIYSILAIVLVIGFISGFVVGEASGWVQCVDLGLRFVNTDNLIDKGLLRSAILQYKSSLGGWAFDPNSPFYVGENET